MIGFLSIVIGLGSLLFAILGAIEDPKPVFVLLGSETVSLVACGVGLFLALGSFREGPALALACVGGSWLAASGMAWLGTSPDHVVAGIALEAWIGGRVVAAGLCGLLGAWVVFSRDRRAPRLALRGVLLAIPLLVVAGMVVTGRTGAIVGFFSGLPAAVRALAALLAFLLFSALTAASVDAIIRAFARGQSTRSE